MSSLMYYYGWTSDQDYEYPTQKFLALIDKIVKVEIS